MGEIFTADDVANLSTRTTIREISEYLSTIGGTLPAETTKKNGRDTYELVLSVVSDKTGYPTDMIDTDMELETDLGIDSIKRVEILSEINKQMGEIFTADDVANLSTRTTIREISEYLSTIDGGTPTEAPTVVATETADEEKTGTSSVGSVETVVLESISDKTGYPTDMIDVTMELETDLGIDSIKRVEIFSAVLTALNCTLSPDEVGEMSVLSDIQSIVAYLATKI